MHGRAIAITLLVLLAPAACASRPAEPPAGAEPGGRPLRACNAYDYGSPIAGEPCEAPQRRPANPLTGFLDGGFVDGAAFGGFHFVVDGGDQPRR